MDAQFQDRCNVLPLFSLPILVKKVDEFTQGDAIRIFDRKFKENPEKLELSSGYYTDFYRERNDKLIDLPTEIPRLMDEIDQARQEYFAATNIQHGKGPEDFQWWTQTYKDYSTHERHNYGINGISGVYWIKADKGSAPLNFINPMSTASYIKYGKSNSKNNKDKMKKKSNWKGLHSIRKLLPEPGLLVLFPSFLDHFVLPSAKDAERAVILFNIGTDI